MSESKIKVERELSEREVKVERENTVSVYATGIFPSGTLTIEENGTYDVTTYKTAEVVVPEPSGTLSITENGTYDVTDYESAEVALPVLTDSDFFTTAFPTNGALAEGIRTYLKRAVFHELNSSTTSINCTNFTLLEYVDFSGMDTSNITTFGAVFYGCTALKYVDISGWTNPNSVSTSSMFTLCSALETLIIDSDEVFNLTANPLFNSTCLIYVPDDLVDSYKAASYWSTRADYIKPLSELPS